MTQHDDDHRNCANRGQAEENTYQYLRHANLPEVMNTNAP
jgi:hypothetical protein